MNLREFFYGQRTASNLGTARFRLTLDKENVKTPNYVMSKALDILETRPSMISGLKQHVRFLVNDIGFTSQDQDSVKFMTEWYDMRKNLHEDIFNLAFLGIGIGTAYFEPTWNKMANGDKVLDNVFNVPDPSIIYRNLNAASDDEYWLMEVPMEVRVIDGKTPQFIPVYYIKGAVYWRRMVWCVKYPKEKFIQFKFGWSRVGFYGWGLLSSAVDNEDVSEEILKNWALQAKYKALGKKIIGFYNPNSEPVSPQELDDIKKEFSTLEEEDSLLTNKKIDQTDLSFVGQTDVMEQQMNFLRRDSGSALVPNYMTAFSQDSSMATAAESKIPFGLELHGEQEQLIKFLNSAILDPLKEAYPFLADDLSFTLGRPDLYSREQSFTTVSTLYNYNAATLNELRLSAGLEPVENGDKWMSDIPNALHDGKMKPLNDPKQEKTFTEKFKKDKNYKSFMEKMKVQNKKIPSTKIEFKKGIKSKEGKQEFKEAVSTLLGKKSKVILE